jgi:hypothetical protein
LPCAKNAGPFWHRTRSELARARSALHSAAQNGLKNYFGWLDPPTLYACPLPHAMEVWFKRRLVGAVGIELKATLKTRKLLILLNAKNAKNAEVAQVKYTAGTRHNLRES